MTDTSRALAAAFVEAIEKVSASRGLTQDEMRFVMYAIVRILSSAENMVRKAEKFLGHVSAETDEDIKGAFPMVKLRALAPSLTVEDDLLARLSKQPRRELLLEVVDEVVELATAPRTSR